MKVWKIIFLSKWMICRFHVNLPRCTPSESREVFGRTYKEWGNFIPEPRWKTFPSREERKNQNALCEGDVNRCATPPNKIRHQPPAASEFSCFFLPPFVVVGLSTAASCRKVVTLTVGVTSVFQGPSGRWWASLQLMTNWICRFELSSFNIKFPHISIMLPYLGSVGQTSFNQELNVMSIHMVSVTITTLTYPALSPKKDMPAILQWIFLVLVTGDGKDNTPYDAVYA